jgi:hypothetical protein
MSEEEKEDVAKEILEHGEFSLFDMLVLFLLKMPLATVLFFVIVFNMLSAFGLMTAFIIYKDYAMFILSFGCLLSMVTCGMVISNLKSGSN